MNTRHKNKNIRIETIQNETQKEFRKMNSVSVICDTTSRGLPCI